MQVKIGNVMYSSDDVPIMVILTDREKIDIMRMATDQNRLATYPNNLNLTQEDVISWMNEKPAKKKPAKKKPTKKKPTKKKPAKKKPAKKKSDD